MRIVKKPTSLVVAAAFAFIAALSAHAAPLPSPAAYWTMDAISDDVLPDQAGPHHATVPQLIGQKDGKSGQILPDFIPTTERGVKGNALALTREQQGFLELSSPKAFNFKSGITISLWVKVERANALMNLLSCVEDVTDPAGGWTLAYSYGDVVFKAADANGKTVTVTLPTKDVAPGYWVHITAVADVTTLRLYLNGIEAASQSFTGPLKMAAETPVVIGNHATIAGWRHTECPAFGGLLDEVKIFEKPLTAAEVQAESEEAL
jgi:hypothetical protein